MKSKHMHFPNPVHIFRQFAAFFARQNHQNAVVFF